MNFALFRNSTYTGATISNFLLNGVAGMLLVSMMLVQLGGGLSAQQAGMLTLGYAIAIVAFIRVGEKLLQKFGARKPMIWGSLIVGLSIAILMPTNLLLGQYKVLATSSPTRSSAWAWRSTRHHRPMRRSRTCPMIKPDPAPASTKWRRRSAPPSASPSRPPSLLRSALTVDRLDGWKA